MVFKHHSIFPSPQIPANTNDQSWFFLDCYTSITRLILFNDKCQTRCFDIMTILWHTHAPFSVHQHFHFALSKSTNPSVIVINILHFLKQLLIYHCEYRYLHCSDRTLLTPPSWLFVSFCQPARLITQTTVWQLLLGQGSITCCILCVQQYYSLPASLCTQPKYLSQFVTILLLSHNNSK